MKKGSKFLSILIAMILITSACSTNNQSGEENEEKTIPVVVQKVEKKSLEKSERYIGLLSAKNDVMVLPKVAGKVKEIYITQGEAVKKDQVIIKLDDTDLQNTLSQAEAGYQASLSNLTKAREGKSSGILSAELQLEQSQDAYNKAKENYDKMKKLYEEKVISKSQLDQAESSFIQAQNGLKLAKNGLENAKSNASISALESQVKQAKLGVEQARRALDNTKVTAPIAGRVSSLMVEQGEMAGPQSPVAQVINQNKMTVKLNITETQLSSFHTGSGVMVNVPSVDQKVKGTISFIAPAANSQTLTFPVEINVDNSNQTLRSGMHVEVLITKTTGKDQLVVPTGAILGSEDDNYVFIVNGKKAEKRKVIVKEMNTKETIIETGLSINDLVIIKGQYDLENNMLIDVVREEGKAS